MIFTRFDRSGRYRAGIPLIEGSGAFWHMVDLLVDRAVRAALFAGIEDNAHACLEPLLARLAAARGRERAIVGIYVDRGR